jgi:hypothetical protein
MSSVRMREDEGGRGGYHDDGTSEGRRVYVRVTRAANNSGVLRSSSTGLFLGVFCSIYEVPDVRRRVPDRWEVQEAALLRPRGVVALLAWKRRMGC